MLREDSLDPRTKRHSLYVVSAPHRADRSIAQRQKQTYEIQVTQLFVASSVLLLSSPSSSLPPPPSTTITIAHSSTATVHSSTVTVQSTTTTRSNHRDARATAGSTTLRSVQTTIRRMKAHLDSAGNCRQNKQRCLSRDCRIESDQVH